MAKTQTSIRLEPEELEAVRRAAADDKRPMAALLRLLIVEGLERRSYLGTAKERAAKPRGRKP